MVNVPLILNYYKITKLCLNKYGILLKQTIKLIVRNII